MKVQEALNFMSARLRFGDQQAIEALEIIALYNQCLSQAERKMGGPGLESYKTALLGCDIGELRSRVPQIKRKPEPRPAGRHAWAR
jgi:hypothetical protein